MLRHAPLAALVVVAAAAVGCAISFRDLPEGADGEGGAGAGGGGAASTGRGSGGHTASSSRTSSASSSASGTGGAGGSCSYAAPETCDTASSLGVINGDTDAQSKGTTGTTLRWLQVEVYENSHGFPAVNLKYTASLTVPAGVVYELYAYEGAADTPTDKGCSAVALTCSGTPCVVADEWGDRTGPDDTRFITFEIRYVSGGVCGADPEWTFTVQGNM